MNTLVKLFWVSRPISWLNTAFPFAAGYLVLGGQVDTLFIVGIMYFLFPYNLFLYGINDVFDYESDILNPRKGGIEGMREERAIHPSIIKSAILLNLPFVVFFMMYGNLASKVVVLFVLFSVLAYSLAGLRFKEIPVLDSATSSMHFVGPLIYALSLNHFPVVAWPYVLSFFLWGMASQAFGAVQDIIPDRKAGLRSIATAFGAKTTVRLATIFYLAAVLIVGLDGGLSIAVGIAGLAYVFNIRSYWSINDQKSGSTNRAWKRFIWINLGVGFLVTILLIISAFNRFA